MANVNSPFGLKPVRYLSGAPWNGKARRYQIAASYGYAIGIGDCVDLAGSSDVTGSAPTVARVTPGSGYPITGVVVALDYNPADLTSLYFVASTAVARFVYVVDDPDVIFEVQASADAVITKDSVGLNGVLVDGSPVVSATTGVSATTMYSGASTGAPAANAAFQLLIMGAVDRPDNDISLINAKWEVLISLHRYKSVYSNSAQAGALGV
jgi:hypothetical protein